MFGLIPAGFTLYLGLELALSSLIERFAAFILAAIAFLLVYIFFKMSKRMKNNDISRKYIKQHQPNNVTLQLLFWSVSPLIVSTSMNSTRICNVIFSIRSKSRYFEYPHILKTEEPYSRVKT
jgi:uncharacterized membrane protein